jgi:hypothetical protein
VAVVRSCPITGDVELQPPDGPGTTLSKSGTRNGRLTAREKVERDAEIVSARASGLPWSEIAAEHRISGRQCRTIVNEYGKTGITPRLRDPVEVVDQMLERYEGFQERLIDIADTATNDSARVGAIKAAMEAMRSQAELMQAIGVLPRDLGRMAVAIDVRRVARAAIEVLDRNGIPAEVQRELVEAVSGGRERAVAGG